MKLTRNAYKRRIIVFGVFLFMSIALISTGFAAWVMSSNATASETGNVEVGIINDARLSITYDNLDELSSYTYYFEPAKNDFSGTFRRAQTESLVEDSSNPDTEFPFEHLGPDPITGQLTNGKEALASFTVKVTLPQGIYAAAEAGYLVLPTCATYTETTGENPVYTPTEYAITLDEAGKFRLDFRFKWGTKVSNAQGNVNPSEYFDQDDVSITDDEAKILLEDLRAYVYGYYDALYAENAVRNNVINAHLNDAMPTFTVEFKAIAK